MVMAMVVAFDRPSANGSLMAATTECANRPAEPVPNGIASHANRTLLWYLSQVQFYYCALSVCNGVQLYCYIYTMALDFANERLGCSLNRTKA